LIGGEEMEVGIFAGGDHVVGEESGRFIGWNATILLIPLILVDALGVNPALELFRSFAASGLLVDALDKTFGNGCLNWVTEEMPRR